VTSARALRRALFIALAFASLAAGCAYTTVAVKEKSPAPGPAVHSGLTAVMSNVNDARAWPATVSSAPIPNVRIFSEEITARVRAGLVEKGLFVRLAEPGSPASQGQPTLRITMTNFLTANLGSNAWVAPHLILDGLMLPAFSGVLIASQGRVDSGAYLIPSTRMGTSFGAKLEYSEPGLPAPVLQREYLVKLEMEAVSERTLLSSLEKGETYGVEIGKAEGYKTLDFFIQSVASDARWAYLPEFRRLVAAEAKVGPGQSPAQIVAAVGGVLDLVKPLTYTEEEVKILRDGYLEAGPRATIANEMRARWLNLPDAKALPPQQRVTEEQAAKLFDDPALLKAEVESILADRALILAMKAINLLLLPQAAAAGPAPGQLTRVAPAVMPAQPAMAGRPEPPTQPARPAGEAAAAPAKPSASPALAAKLRSAVAERLKGDPRLQALLLNQAETAVGPAWEPMRVLLEEIGSPATTKYLSMRRG
jgi:hypothetical protein